MTLEHLVFDWNRERRPPPDRSTVALNDETLRDGLQSPSIVDPTPEAKIHLLHLMADLGIGAVTLGFPGAGSRMLAQTRLLATEIAAAGLPVAPNCVARMVETDVRPIVEVALETGLPIQAALFIGASAVRQAADGWTLDHVLSVSERAVDFTVRAGLSVMFVAEDATRTAPETLRALYGNAIRRGAKRICVADTSGHATPAGVARLLGFVRDEIIAPSGEDVGLDWHGHRDRGLAIANCLAATAAGADRIHATALGIGERAGNAEMELLLANLYLQGEMYGDLRKLPEYCRTASEILGVPISTNHPVVGADAFRTASGVHASAILKALVSGDRDLADLLYSSLPASAFGLVQGIDVSAMSGMANVKHWLGTHGYDPNDRVRAEALLHAAKRSGRALDDDECAEVVGR